MKPQHTTAHSILHGSQREMMDLKDMDYQLESGWQLRMLIATPHAHGSIFFKML